MSRNRQTHNRINHCSILRRHWPLGFLPEGAFPLSPNPGSLCEVGPPQAALGRSRLAHRHLLPDHGAGSFCQLPGFPPLHHPLGTHQPPQAEPLQEPPGGAACRAVIGRNHLLQVGTRPLAGPSGCARGPPNPARPPAPPSPPATYSWIRVCGWKSSSP